MNGACGTTACAIRAIGVHLPSGSVPSAALEQRLGLEAGWIEQRTGIRSRWHVPAGCASSDLAALAVRAAVANAGVPDDSIDLLVCATCTADMVLPSTACWTHRALGWRPIPAFDVAATCAGFLYAMQMAAGLLAAGFHRRIAVVAAETMSHHLDPHDKQCGVLFGDGAAAAIVEAEGWLRLLDSQLGADGSLAELITIPAGGTRRPASAATLAEGGHCLRMNGREVFRQAVDHMVGSVRRMLATWSLSLADIAWVVPHQANARIAEAVAERLQLPREKLVLDMSDLGNTAGATIPLALERARPRMRRGERVLVTTFGAGATWGCQLYEVMA